jgi:hypothetical protein
MGLQRLYVDPRENHSAFSLVPGKQNLVIGRSSAGGNIGQGFLEGSTGLFRDWASQGMSFDNFLKISGDVHQGTIRLNGNALLLAIVEDG